MKNQTSVPYALSALAFFALSAGFAAAPVVARASEVHLPEIKIYSSGDLKLEQTFSAYDSGMNRGVNIAVGDLTGDGRDEIVTAPNQGAVSQVRTLSMSGKALGFQRVVFAGDYKGGVSVATGDVDGDGKDEIIVSQLDGQAWVKVYRYDGTVMANFLAMPKEYTHGVSVAAADLKGDGKSEIITATSIGARTQIRSFDAHGAWAGLNIFPFSDSFTGGASVSRIDTDGDGKDEIMVGQRSRGDARVKVYRGNGSNAVVSNFVAFSSAHEGGVHVTAADITHDGKDEIIVGIGNGSQPEVRTFTASGARLSQTLHPYPADFSGGVVVAAGNLDGDATLDIVTAPSRFVTPAGVKKIEVDLSEQKMRVTEGGVIVKTFLISSGVARHPSPVGSFSILKKIPVKDYKWDYGKGNPDNYDLKNVKDNMQFYGPYFLHSAYWHHNFGHRMSHGCINMSIPDARWLYQWSEVGTPVIIHN